MADDYERERRERYLKIATDMDGRARRADDAAVAEAYRHIAASWRKLAEEAAGRPPANEEPAIQPDDHEPDEARA